MENAIITIKMLVEMLEKKDREIEIMKERVNIYGAQLTHAQEELQESQEEIERLKTQINDLNGK